VKGSETGVVRAADDAVDVGLVLIDHRTQRAIRVRTRVGGGIDEVLVVGDELESRREIALPDLVQAVDDRHDCRLRTRDGAAVVAGERCRRRHRKVVAAQRAARLPVFEGTLDNRLGLLRDMTDPGRAGEALDVVHRVMRGISEGRWIDGEVTRRAQYLSVEARRRVVESHRRGGIGQALAHKRLDGRAHREHVGLKLRMHHGRFNDLKVRQFACGRGQRQDQRRTTQARGELQRRTGEELTHGGEVERVGPIDLRTHPLATRCRPGRERCHGRPERLAREVGGLHHGGRLRERGAASAHQFKARGEQHETQSARTGHATLRKWPESGRKHINTQNEGHRPRGNGRELLQRTLRP
jgi:hypothetical protein